MKFVTKTGKSVPSEKSLHVEGSLIYKQAVVYHSLFEADQKAG